MKEGKTGKEKKNVEILEVIVSFPREMIFLIIGVWKTPLSLFKITERLEPEG